MNKKFPHSPTLGFVVIVRRVPIYILSAASLLLYGCFQDTSNQKDQTSKSSRTFKNVLVVPPLQHSETIDMWSPNAGDAPMEILFQWVQNNPPAKKVNATPAELSEALNAEHFDCATYHLNAELRQALTAAPKLSWLSIYGANATDFEFVCSLQKLRGLIIKELRGQDIDWSQLAGLTNLEYLSIVSADMPSTFDLPPLPALEILSYPWGLVVGDSFVPDSGDCVNLKCFAAQGSSISDAGIEKLSLSCPNLKYLNLSKGKNITPASIDHFSKLNSLKYLHIGLTPLQWREYDPDYGSIPVLQQALPNTYIGFGS